MTAISTGKLRKMKSVAGFFHQSTGLTPEAHNFLSVGEELHRELSTYSTENIDPWILGDFFRHENMGNTDILSSL